MAGVKGKGGVKGRSGGARPGAGRKPKAKQPTAVPPESNVEPAQEPSQPIEDCSMLDLLQAVALGKVKATSLQVRAAIAAVQYTHHKRGDGGIKEGQAGAAKQAAKRFTAVAAPLKLVKAK